jgi:mannosyltransferase OCH1-like enzyme
MKDKYPKNIFQVWYQGCDKIEREEFKINMKSWKEMNPDWNYNCVDDKFMEKTCLEFSKECHTLYKQTKIMHIKIDLARYVLLYIYGGMYVDMDAYILRPLNYSKQVNEIIKKYEIEKKEVIGLSKLKLNVVESIILSQKMISYNNAVMFSSPRNPALKRFIEFILKKIKSNIESKLDNYWVVQKSTGPTIFNQFFGNKKELYDTEVVIFNPSIFEPCDIGQNCDIRNETIAIHLFERSWLPKYAKIISEVYYVVKPIIMILIIILFILIIKKFIKNRIKK